MASTVPNNEATQFKTGKKQVEIARKGGIASGKAKRLKKTMRDSLIALLNSNIPNKKMTYQEATTIGLLKGAIKGNSQNYRTIVEMLGELEQGTVTSEPIININMIDNEKLEKDFFEKEDK